MNNNWNPGSWRKFPAKHQPDWPDDAELEQVQKTLADQPPLVFAGEARNLTSQLARVVEGNAFLLQAGDCAESFDSSTDSIRDKLRVILQMAIVLTYSGGTPLVKVGRIAGQFAKPRSNPTETQGETELPSFLGQIVNDVGFTVDERRPDPQRLLTAYHRAASTLNLLRALTRGGYADLNQVSSWNRDFVASSPAGERYAQMADEIDRALRFMAACGLDSNTVPALHEVDLFTSHEALLLNYEEALTRRDSLTGDWYDCSAHMLWVGERTRELDGAHVEFLRGVGNPLGCKLGPTTTVDEVLGICEALNPDRVPGKLTLISRMGAGKIADGLPALLAAVREAGHPVVWACDPMHGNTYTSEGGRKTRHFDDVLSEIVSFFAAHESEGTHPGGVHVELTGDPVTECLGGSDDLVDDDLERAYETMCDPRLNGRQSVDLAFRVAELLRSNVTPTLGR
ncbi:MAG: 3-deoxy-7-phosphoheptulonate synthase class II [Acidimicrobiaceae bacterium]|nr:3-deoxy-7-phosphoheptulonate synthase class II [Acidimicrobiaceae bacterium]MXW60286.1 3-deoxy-7-phosphoheptulonate synthase class II [Acidimicrobiaceae bacterium]MXW77120.1 3-deoxy-7-phosphoheptulonate synthase class II [Acidimicrobiaceae bacterium]MYC42760.1 3-deoxy-7-phosphoheptulonate synthase class II [Acidimicrobiaceae bacterium]MYD06407.1 3-deoxy-7-phosphoheptulonate synthase class II [Acidimicrobiaceae bacterium]